MSVISQALLRAVRYFVLLIALISLTRITAYADEIQLTCVEMSLSSAIFPGGAKSTTEYNRSLQLTIDTANSTVAVSSGNGYAYEVGTFPLQVTDAAFEWNGNVIQGHVGYNHYMLDRYTTDLHAVNTPLPGQQVIEITTNFKCEKLQRQF